MAVRDIYGGRHPPGAAARARVTVSDISMIHTAVHSCVCWAAAAAGSLAAVLRRSQVHVHALAIGEHPGGYAFMPQVLVDTQYKPMGELGMQPTC